MTMKRTACFALVFTAGLLFPSVSPAGEDIQIAAIFAVTGPAAKANAHSLEGARLAVRELNRRGGVLGRQLKMVEIDNQSSPIGSKVAADKASRLEVTAIVGAVWSSHSMAVAQVAQEQGIPMITNMSTHPDVTRSRDYVFRTCFTDDFQGRVMARFAAEDLGGRTALIFRDVASDYSIGLAHDFKQGFEALGGEVLMVVDYKHTQACFKDTAGLAAGLNPDVVFVPGYDESGAIIQEALDAGMAGTFIGGDGWGPDGFFEQGGDLLERGYYCNHWCKDVETELSRRFVELARRIMGVRPGSLTSSTPLAFDAVMLLADALERAGSTDRKRLRKALAGTRDFQGVTGSISFDEHGDPLKDAVIMEVSNRSRRYFKRVPPDGQ
ncbi:MAG: ABC transporter substrate-binding protein [Desulfatiglandales bacterium]